MKRWLAVFTKPRQERRAVANLERQEFEVFCPMLRERRKRDGAIQWSTGPLFPRYVFAHIDPDAQSIAPIRSTFGCVDLVRFEGRPATVPDVIIEALQQQPVEFEPASQFKAGEQLDVVDGPFAGLDAIYQCTRSQDRVAVLLEMMGQWRSVELPAVALARA